MESGYQNDIPLKFKAVESLPTHRAGYFPCGELTDCRYNAVRLFTLDLKSGLRAYCGACKASLCVVRGKGWVREEKDRIEAAREREEALETQQKLANPVWDEMRAAQEEIREAFTLEKAKQENLFQAEEARSSQIDIAASQRPQHVCTYADPLATGIVLSCLSPGCQAYPVVLVDSARRESILATLRRLGRIPSKGGGS